MKPRNLNSISAFATDIPTSPDSVLTYLHEEMPRIWAAIRLLSVGHIDITYVAPDKPRAGDFRYADGVKWNPGYGEGIYYFKSSTNTWTFWG